MKKNPARNVHLKKSPSRLLEEINSSIDIDSRLFNEDIIGSIAHSKMLIKTKIISTKDGNKIIRGLNEILKDIKKNKIRFESKYEDIHMNIEALLFKKIGSLAGKLHTARSRNDQVVTDFKLWIKNNSIKRIKQDHSISNIWRKRGLKDGIIDWRMSSIGIYNLVRALTKPYIGAIFYYKEIRL